jgi:predicted nucleic acid-binding protein
MIILDTNVLSEPLKKRPKPAVLRWLAAQEPSGACTTALTQAEMLYGIEALPPGKRKTGLATAIETMFAEEFPSRILPFDSGAARIFSKIVAGRDAVGRPISQTDAMIAAIARSHGAALATRNTGDFEHCGIRVVNPWIE